MIYADESSLFIADSDSDALFHRGKFYLSFPIGDLVVN